MLALGTEGWVQSISWSDGNLNKALVSLALVLHMLVVFIDYVLVFFCVVTCRVTTCLENPEYLEMSGNLTAVRKMSGILLKIRELSGKKSCQGKAA